MYALSYLFLLDAQERERLILLGEMGYDPWHRHDYLHDPEWIGRLAIRGIGLLAIGAIVVVILVALFSGSDCHEGSRCDDLTGWEEPGEP